VQNYFELFNIPVSFGVDIDMLAQHFRQLQQCVHPDKFVTSSAQARRLSIQYAARVNDGYQVLKSPLKRAQYLLELYYKEISELSLQHDAQHEAQHKDSPLDHVFLTQQIELREALEDITHTGDPVAALNVFVKQVCVMENDIIVELTTQFALYSEKKSETHSATHDLLAQISETIKRMQFINKLKEEAVELEDTLYAL